MIDTEYINIFTEYRDVIDSNSVKGINVHRQKALEAFIKWGFPTKAKEDFKYIDVASEFAFDYGLNLNRVPFKGNPYSAFKCEIPNLSTNLYFILNDLFNHEGLLAANHPKDVFIGSLKRFAELYPNIFEKHYAQIAEIDKEGITAFNTMFVQDGFAVYIPKYTILEDPIQLTNILKSDHNYLVNRRVLIIVEENSQVKILSCDHTVDESQFLVTQVVEIFAGENANVEVYELEENSDKTVRFNSTYVHQEKGSNVLINSLTLNSGKTRNDYHIKLAQEYAESHIYGMVIADKDQYVDNFVLMDHASAHCQSTQKFKYILQNESIGVFCGRIKVEKDSQKTEAYQTNNNLCISPQSRMYSKPQLEIYADDVKCSHGLTTGELDENALFYLRSRGISMESAKLMLMQAFMADILEYVRIDKLQDRLSDLVEKRLKGESARCGNCAICK